MRLDLLLAKFTSKVAWCFAWMAKYSIVGPPLGRISIPIHLQSWRGCIRGFSYLILAVELEVKES